MIVIALIPDVDVEEAGLVPALPKAGENITKAISAAAAKLRIPEQQLAKIVPVVRNVARTSKAMLTPGKSVKSAIEPALAGGFPHLGAGISEQLAKFMAENGGGAVEIARTLLSRSVRIIAQPVKDFTGSEFTAALVTLMKAAGRPEQDFKAMYRVYREMLQSVNGSGRTRFGHLQDMIAYARSIELQEQAVEALKQANPGKTMIREPFKDADVAAQGALAGLDSEANPEGMLDGVVFDVYAPRRGTSAANIVAHLMKSKIGHQAYHFVLNLADSNVSVPQLVDALEAQQVNLRDLQEIVVYTRDGRLISNVVPWRR
jgi:hypothetical protein